MCWQLQFLLPQHLSREDKNRSHCSAGSPSAIGGKAPDSGLKSGTSDTGTGLVGGVGGVEEVLVVVLVVVVRSRYQ